MAIFSANNYQSTNEIRTYTIDYTDSLPTGGTVTAGTAIHTPPSGTASTPAVSVVSPYVYVTLSAPTVVGIHYIDVIGTFSDGDKSAARLAVNVLYPTPTARTGMSDIISTLRGMTGAGVGDYNINGLYYWSDKQLQDILDKYRTDYYEREMSVVDEYTGGSPTTTKYYVGSFNIESGTAVFWVQNAEGTKATETTDYTVDYALGLVTFNADTDSKEYYATYRSFDLNGAAAEIWRMKAAHYADMFTFSAGGQSVQKGALIKQALEMAKYYSQARGARSIELTRDDLC